MSKVFLISDVLLKEETIINDNVGAEFIGPAIETAQDIYLQQIIGTELLDKMYALVVTNQIIDDANKIYKELLDDYITPYLKFKVLSEITVPLAYKYRNAGVVQSTANNYQQTTLKDAQLVANHYNLRADFFVERMNKFLCANASQIPEYGSARDASDFRSNPDAYNTNWVL